MRFIWLKNIHVGGTFHRNKNVQTRINLRFYKIRKIPSSVDLHKLYQLLHSQVYRNGL